jgi:hypothetical protein
MRAEHARQTVLASVGESGTPGLAPHGERYAQRRIVALVLLAPIRGMPLLLAKALHRPVQAFGFDALFAP